MKSIMIYWFKWQSDKAARHVLKENHDKKEIEAILNGYWKRYIKLKREAPSQPTFGGSLMVHLSVLSTAFYRELRNAGYNEKEATDLFFEIAWMIYKKMGKYSWIIAGLSGEKGYSRLKKATDLFRTFPFNSPSYLWEDVPGEKGVVAFNCLKCPVAEYFKSQGLSGFCYQTWCKLDFPLARAWNAQLERENSIAGGAELCDFKWKFIERNNK